MYHYEEEPIKVTMKLKKLFLLASLYIYRYVQLSNTKTEFSGTTHFQSFRLPPLNNDIESIVHDKTGISN